MQQETEEQLLCPTFNSYSSDRLVEIATKVSDDFKRQYGNIDDGFEFVTVPEDSEASADENVPVFPIFNRDSLPQDGHRIHRNEKIDKREDHDTAAVLVPLKNLFLGEREPPSSSSSSEADELETISPQRYCLWRPKVSESSPNTCRKSKSTGSVSKRFRIRDLLRRSNSDGKESFVFLAPKSRSQATAGSSEKVDTAKSKRHSVDSSGKVAAGKSKAPPSPASSAHELFYKQNRTTREGEKRKSYLPYRKDLLGFFR